MSSSSSSSSSSSDHKQDFQQIRQAPAWMLVFFSNMFCGCCGLSIVLPTLWPYLREMQATPHMFACAVALNSIGEGVGGLLCGRLYARFPHSSKRLLLSFMCLGFSAGLSYSTAKLYGNQFGVIVVLIARFFSGVDNGARMTIEQTFIGSVVPAKDQTTVRSRLSSCAITGIMLGPALGAPMHAMDLHLPGLNLTINGNNAPGMVLSAVCAMNIFVTWRYFDASAVQQAREGTRAAADSVVKRPSSAQALPPSKIGLFMCYAVGAAANLSVASSETAIPLVTQRLFGWGPCLDPHQCTFRVQQTYINLLMTCGGLCSFCMSLVMAFFLAKHVYGREMLAIGLSLSVFTLTNTSNVDWGGSLPTERFVFAYWTGALFGSFLRGPNISLLSQIIGPHDKAPYMGLLFAVGALPRAIGPVLMVELLTLPQPLRNVDFEDVYSGPLPRTWLLYGTQAVLFLSMLVLLAFARGPVRRHLEQLRKFKELV